MKKSNMALALAGLYAQVALAMHITPIEVLQRPLVKSAMLFKTSSHASQYAGRTTIESGSTSQVVSTNVVNSDSLIYALPQAALASTFATLGRVAIASGIAIGTASTPAVYSGDVISALWESPNDITSGMSLRVNSIVDGVSFALTTGNGLTTVASGAVAMWKIHGKDPQGLKVNSIGVGHFILGWADGRARPYDTTAMWEIRRST